MKKYREWNPRQNLLLPASLMDWLPKNHIAYFLLDVVAELDLTDIERALQAKDPRGTRPYPPRMMVGLLLYGYCVGVYSSRKLERATHENVGFRVLSGGCHPDHSTISEFRKSYLRELSTLFVQVLRLCEKAGLVKLGHVALDGTKMAGNASKHKANSYERMTKREQELGAEVAALLKEAEKIDASEDAKYGKSKRGDELPEELQRREKRLRKLKEAKEALEAEAAMAHAEHKRTLAKRAEQEAEAADISARESAKRRAAKSKDIAEKSAQSAKKKAEERLAHASAEADRLSRLAVTRSERCEAASARKNEEDAEQGLEKADDLVLGRSSENMNDDLPSHRVPFDRDGNPKPGAQRNYTDPDSKIMKSGDGYIQGYNCQTVVDAEHQVIVSQAVSNQAPDQEHLRSLLNGAVENCGRVPKRFTADAGYWSEENDRFCRNLGTDAYISTARKQHGSSQSSSSASSSNSSKATAKQRMAEKCATEEGRAIYARRKVVVEPPYGHIKEARGFRRFMLRGMKSVRAEWALICASHNLLKLFHVRTG